MISLPFDQYQRYSTAQRVVNSIRKNNETFTILEVGANEHQNLEKFLPEDEITYLDIQLPEHLLNRPEYILGDATKMSFPESKYDIIVALDVFEHIVEEDRKKFIDELHRVSKKLFIIGAPFYAEEVSKAEEEANDYYKLLQGNDYIWLKEHMDNTLPDLQYYLHYMKAQGMRYQHFSHGSIDKWNLLMKIHFLATLSPALTKDRIEIDRFYNQNLYLTDTTEQCYRNFIVGYKGDTEYPNNIFMNKDEEEISMYTEFLKLEIEFYSKFINIVLNERNQNSNLTNTHISNLEDIIAAKDEHISNLKEMLISKDTHISNIEGVSLMKDKHLSNLEETVASKDVHIFNLEGMITSKDVHISNLEGMITSKDTQVSNLEKAVTSKDVHISNLEEMISSKDAQVFNLEEAISFKDVHISNLEDMIQGKDQYIGEIENKVAKYKEELDIINNTLLGKLLERSKNLRRRR